MRTAVYIGILLIWLVLPAGFLDASTAHMVVTMEISPAHQAELSGLEHIGIPEQSIISPNPMAIDFSLSVDNKDVALEIVRDGLRYVARPFVSAPFEGESMVLSIF